MKYPIDYIPPEIISMFDKNLLSKPMPKFGEDSEDLLKMWLYIERRLKKKTRRSPQCYEQFMKLENQFKDLYERVKAKEEDLKAEAKNHFPRPFNYFDSSYRRHPKILDRLRKAKYKFTIERGKNDSF